MSEVDINRASVYELERAFHSRERAQEILNKREQFGDFKDWEDVREKVYGVSDRITRELSDSGVTVGAQQKREAPALSRRRVRSLGRSSRTTRRARMHGSS